MMVKRLALAVICALSMAGAQAAEAPFGAGCLRKCASLEPVHVMLVDPGLKNAGGARFQTDLAEVARFPAKSTHVYRREVRSPSEIPAVLDELAGQCKRVKTLVLFLHGGEGYVSLHNGKSLNVLNLDAQLGAVSCAMAKDAWIGFLGCNVGGGCRGEDFLQAVGRVLLPQGGKVIAPAEYLIYHEGGKFEPFSKDGKWQSVAVESGPRIKGISSFARPPVSAKECVDGVDHALDMIAAMERTYRSCWRPVAFEVARELRQELHIAKGNQASLMLPFMSRVGLDAHKTAAAKSLYRALTDYDLEWGNLVCEPAPTNGGAPWHHSIPDMPPPPVSGVFKGY